MAVTAGFNPIIQPKRVANSPTIAVIIPMNIREITNDHHPPPNLAGGTRAKMTFHPIEEKCRNASNPSISSKSPSSLIYGASIHAVLN
jgi:hypothetical protein